MISDMPVFPGLAYGATEGMLASLHETDAESIRSRFRKLRLRPFPDDIRSGTGIRVVYDLPRILALAAVFDLNRLYVPQGHAVEIVQSTWPEWCRAYLAAAVDIGTLPSLAEMPDHASSVIHLQPDAYGGTCFSSNEPFAGAEARTRREDGADGAAPMISIDTSRAVGRLTRATDLPAQAGLRAAFLGLDLSFGWTASDTPHRAGVEEMAYGRGFLDEGPYFDRADALLGATELDFDQAQRPLSFRRLEALLSYLERPAPLDRWKAEIGSEEDRPRLKHLLVFFAESMGLRVMDSYPSTMKALGVAGARALAMGYIAAARAKQSGRAMSPRKA